MLSSAIVETYLDVRIHKPNPPSTTRAMGAAACPQSIDGHVFDFHTRLPLFTFFLIFIDGIRGRDTCPTQSRRTAGIHMAWNASQSLFGERGRV